MDLVEELSMMIFCKENKPVMAHKELSIYIHKIDNGTAYVSQVNEDKTMALFSRGDIFGDVIVVKIKDEKKHLRFIPLNINDFVPFVTQTLSPHAILSACVF